MAGDERLLTGVTHKLDGCVGDLKRILAVRSGLDDIEGMISNAELDPRLPELLDGFRARDGRSALEVQDRILGVEQEKSRRVRRIERRQELCIGGFPRRANVGGPR